MNKNVILSFIVVVISLYSCNDHAKKQETSKEQVVDTKSEPPLFKDSVTNQDTSISVSLCGNSIFFDDKAKPTIAENGIYISVEQMPQFPGGAKALMDYIKKNLKYPKIAVENNIQGQVIVRFVVNKKGQVEDVQVLRSLDAACDKEAVRIIKSMKSKWIPGKQSGKAVDVYYTLPVRFKLEEEVKSK